MAQSMFVSSDQFIYSPFKYLLEICSNDNLYAGCLKLKCKNLRLLWNMQTKIYYSGV